VEFLLLQVKCAQKFYRETLLTDPEDSPRWLVSKDRSEDALKALSTLRRKEDVDSGLVELEIAALREEGRVVMTKDGWLALFNSKNRRRTR
jgi:MFS transporter, SP family, sugar:H+ symporter